MECIKNMSKDFLIQNNVIKLRFTVSNFDVLSEKIGISLMDYVEGRELIERYQLEKYLALDSFSYICGGATVSFYSPTLSYSNRIFAIAHEIGHVYMKHSYCGIYGQSENPALTDMQESEANTFAYELLAPLAILKKCNVNSISKIKRLTMLDGHHAEHVLGLLSDYQLSHDDAELLEHFRSFIRANSCFRRNFSRAAVCAVAIAASALLLMPVLHSNRGVPVDAPAATIPTLYQATPIVVVPSPVATASETASISVSVSPQEIAVYATKSGEKYHLRDCYHITRSTDIKEMTINEAIQLGYEPCKSCRPDDK